MKVACINEQDIYAAFMVFYFAFWKGGLILWGLIMLSLK